MVSFHSKDDQYMLRAYLKSLFFIFLFFVISFFFLFNPFTSKAEAATRYWVGGGSSANWNATGNTNWGTASGVRDNASVPTVSDDVIFDNSANGNSPCTISAAATAQSINASAYANTLTHNAFNLTVAGSITFGASMTYTPLTTSTVTMSATGTLTTNGKLIPLLSGTGGTMTLGDDLNFMVSKVTTLSLSNTALVLNGKTISGNSVTNRVLIKSGTIGTGKQITVGTGHFANADFQDVIFSNTTDLDLSAITGNSGDAGGNTITGGGTVLTFTPSATQTATVAVSKNWSDATIWTSRVPLPQDDVNLSGVTGGTLASDMPRLGKNINWTGASGSPVWSFGSTANSIFGSVTLISGMTISGTQTLTLMGRASYSLTSAGRQYTNPIKINAPSGTYVLNDDLSMGTDAFFQLDGGGFNANNHNVTIWRFFSQNLGTRTLTMGTGIWTLNDNGDGNASWQMTSATGLTFSGASSTIVIGTATANARTFLGIGLTFGTLTYTVAGSTGKLTISGNNSFDTINFSDATNARALEFTAGTVTTFRGAGLVGNGSSGKKIILQSTGAFFTFTKTSGTMSIDWWNISNAHAQGGAIFLAGTNSTDSGGNSGWTFGGPIGPSSLGPAGYVNGSFGTSATPQLTFTITDTDTLATVQYHIQIDDTSDFSSPVIDYTSALSAQGATSFTVGQAPGSGTYTTGSSGQTLADGNYYWRVMATDSNAASSSYATANSGAIAFAVDKTAHTYDPWIMGYYSGWETTGTNPMQANQIDFTHLTHIVFGAILPVSDGTLNTTFYLDAVNGPALAADVASRAHAAGKKALLMVGGAGSASSGFAGAASDTYRATFVANLISTKNTLGYDGIDIDWEPIPTDTTNYQKLIEDLRAADPSMLLTTAVPQVNPNFQTAKPVFSSIWPLVDRIDIMTYDMGNNGAGWLSWHNAPLTGSAAQTPTTVDTSVNAYLLRGVPTEKLGIGSPFYGQGWRGVTGPRQDITGMSQVGSDSSLSYKNIMSLYYTAGAYNWDAVAKVPYLSFASQTGPVGATYISYENEQSIAEKASYIETQGLGGVIIWSLAEGRTSAGTQPILTSWYEGLIPAATTPSPGTASTSVALTATISFTAGSGATIHGIYFGTNASPGASEYKGNQISTTYDPVGNLATNTTYYWRIDEVNGAGTTTGMVWSFTTGVEPGLATVPSPTNAATSIATTTTLGWTIGANTTAVGIYFGTAAVPGASEYKGNESAGTATYDPAGDLAASTTYYWRIDGVNEFGTTTGTVWSFTTTPTSSPVSVSPSGGGGSCSNCGSTRKSGGHSTPSASPQTASTTIPATTTATTQNTSTPSTPGFTCATAGQYTDDLSTAGLVNLFVSLGIIPQEKAQKACDALLVGQTSSTAPVVAKFTIPLKLGSRGSDVHVLQQFLNTHGFAVAATGDGSPAHETDFYGVRTSVAVARFQEAYRTEILLPVGLTHGSGYFGPATMRKVNELLER